MPDPKKLPLPAWLRSQLNTNPVEAMRKASAEATAKQEALEAAAAAAEPKKDEG